MIIFSQLCGFVWYSFLFGKMYQKELKVTDADMQKGASDMPKNMIFETIARLLYFVALAIILWLVSAEYLWIAGIAYFCAALTADWSSVIWSNGQSWRMWVMRSGKLLIDTIVAIVLYGML